jgi:hypothetical protein
VVVVHVEDEHAMAAPGEVVANAGGGDVEEVALAFRGMKTHRDKGEDEEEKAFHGGGEEEHGA